MFSALTVRRIFMAMKTLLYRNGHKNNSPRWALLEGFEIPDATNPDKTYLTRLRILQTPLFGIYLHRIAYPDSRKIFHNHPFAFLSILLRGQYTEMTPGPGSSSPESTAPYAVPRRIRFVNVKRYNKSWHWIDEIHRDPVWTLVFVGRRRRVWGYLDKSGNFTEYDKYNGPT